MHQSTATTIITGGASFLNAASSHSRTLFLSPPLWHHAGEGVHSEAAVPPAGGGEGGVHPGDSRRVEAAEAAAPEAGGGVRQGREALAAGARRHGPALPPGEHEDGRAKVPAGRQVVEQGGGVGALQPGLPVPARQGPRVPSPHLTGGACLSVTVGDFL